MRWLRETDLCARALGSPNLETAHAGPVVDTDIETELLAGTGRGEHGSGEHVKPKGQGGGSDLHLELEVENGYQLL